MLILYPSVVDSISISVATGFDDAADTGQTVVEMATTWVVVWP